MPHFSMTLRLAEFSEKNPAITFRKPISRSSLRTAPTASVA